MIVSRDNGVFIRVWLMTVMPIIQWHVDVIKVALGLRQRVPTARAKYEQANADGKG